MRAADHSGNGVAVRLRIGRPPEDSRGGAEYDRRDGTLANTVATIFTALNLPTYRGRYRDARRSRAR